ncbi:MAG: Mth938-like domain-containing protein [Rickettsiales bacterium]
MHDIMPPVGTDAQLIRSYGPEGFRIGNAEYKTHVLVLPNATYPWNGEFTVEALAPLLNTIPPTEIFLLGTGKRHEMVDATFRKTLKARGIGSDTMDTGAACRTFNILLGEGRRVATALRLQPN